MKGKAVRRIIRPMRVWLLVLLMLLMPLRGLVGSAMAGAMPSTAAAAAGMDHDHSQAQARHSVAERQHDCAGMQTAVAQPEPPRSGHESSAMAHGCESCSACQVCSSPALTLDSAAGIALPIHHASPAGEAPQFASADLRPGHKPPIS
jgi:hypothetical protein